MIILFGSRARGDWVKDPVTGYLSDVDVLVIVASEEVEADHGLWARVEEQARAIAEPVPVTLLVHTMPYVNQEIRMGQYFFAEVARQGVLLFKTKGAALAKPRALNDGERLAVGARDFRYWFESASGFFKGSLYYVVHRMRAHSAFLLHQAAERYFHAALLVFTGYKPQTHDLKKLADQTEPLHPALAGAFPRTDPEDERLFKLLKRAYIEARYSKSYRVTNEELAALRERVLHLGARVREACAEKLVSYCGPEAVGELPVPPKEEEAMELPEPPALDDPRAVEQWRDAIAAMSFEHGEAAGLEKGLKKGEAAGLEKGELKATRNALRRILARRGIELRPEDSARIDACADLPTLERWLAEAAVADRAEDALR
ncbi:MAG TPA: HEPN domain-containing protein [Polyangiaceae bacterium]|nr:HEPN domain-containing protein [Polyangiaceae bacterium]